MICQRSKPLSQPGVIAVWLCERWGIPPEGECSGELGVIAAMRRPVGVKGILVRSEFFVLFSVTKFLLPPSCRCRHASIRTHCFATAVLTFFIAGLLFLCASSTWILGSVQHPVGDQPSHLICFRQLSWAVWNPRTVIGSVRSRNLLLITPSRMKLLTRPKFDSALGRE
jgi:hypothetical protein